MTFPSHIAISADALEMFCEKWRVRELSLFGSVLCDDFGPGSDVDVLVSSLANAAASGPRDSVGQLHADEYGRDLRLPDRCPYFQNWHGYCTGAERPFQSS